MFKIIIAIVIAAVLFLLAIMACLYNIKTRMELDKTRMELDKSRQRLMNTLEDLKKQKEKEKEELLSDPVDEATRAVVKEMYPRPLTSEEAEKEVLDCLKNGPMPGVVTERLECGTIVTQHPFELEIPEGYEMARLNRETGKFEYSDGTIEYNPSKLRKISQ
jgi:hypothetical protein